MNRKFSSFLLSLIFLFETPTIAFAKHISNDENINKETSGTLKESTISMILSKIKNDIDGIYIAITTGVVAFDLYLLYSLFFGSNQNQCQNVGHNVEQQLQQLSQNISHNVEQQLQRCTAAHNDASTMTTDIIGKMKMNDVPMFGINNPGNSCYINAVMQLLYRNNKFRNHILNQRNIDQNQCPFTWAIHRIFCSITYQRRMYSEELSKCLEMLGYSLMQQDAGEFMRIVIERCSQELNAKKSIIDINDGVYLDGNNLIDVIRNAAPIRSGAAEKIRNSVRDEHPDWDSSDIRFQQCVEKEVENLNRLTDYDSPKIETNDGTEIIIPINRTLWNRSGKNCSILNVPTELNLNKNFGIDDSKVYKLSRFIAHYGNSRDFGHYVTWVCQGDKWYCLNDKYVTEDGNRHNLKKCTMQEDLEKNSTVLVYMLPDVTEVENAGGNDINNGNSTEKNNITEERLEDNNNNINDRNSIENNNVTEVDNDGPK